MDQTPPKAFLDDEDVGFGKTPEPRRRRIEELERRGELLCREKGSLVRKLDAETKRFESTLKLKMTESEEMRVLLLKTQKELERCKAEGESMREELDMFALVAQQKALLALAQEQLQVVELEHRLVQSEQQRVMRDHRIALFYTRETELLAEVEERDQRIAELESFNQTNTFDKEDLASSARTSAAELAKALKANAGLTAQVEKLESSAITLKAKEKELTKALSEKTKLVAEVEGLEASVEMWKGKEKEVRDQLEALAANEKDSSSDKEVRNLKAQLRSVKADLDTKDGEYVDLQEELASLKEKSKEKERDLKAKLKLANEQSEQAVSLQEQIDELKLSTKKAMAEAERAKVALKAAGGAVLPSEQSAAARKKASPAKVAKVVKEKVRKAASVEPESEAEMIPKKTKRVHESPAKVITKKLSKLSQEIADESDGSDAPSPPKARKSSLTQPRKISMNPPLGESSILNRLVKSTTTSALASKRKPDAPKIMVTPADDEGSAVGGGGGDTVSEKVQGEKKKKRKLLGTKAAFKWDPILESGSGVIPSTFSPMKPGTTGSIPRLGLTHSSSARGLSRI